MTHAHGPRRSAEEQARLDAALTDLFERRITFNQVLGLRVTQLAPQVQLGRHRSRREHLSPRVDVDQRHQPATLDATGGFALMVAIGEKHADETTEQVMHRFARMGTIDLRIDYLRQGLGQRFVASAEVTRLGGRVGSTLMRLVNEQGTLIATGAAAYMIS